MPSALKLTSSKARALFQWAGGSGGLEFPPARLLSAWRARARRPNGLLLLPAFSYISRRFHYGRSGFLTVTVALLVCLAASGCLAPRSGNQAPEPGGPEYSALMVSSDLARGTNRVEFALVDRNNMPVGASEATVIPRYTPPGADSPQQRDALTATFLPWPPEGSGRGVFITTVNFDVPGDATTENPGLWELQIAAKDLDGMPVEAVTAVRVSAKPSTPAIGSAAPRSVTPTADEAPDLAHITSAFDPDPEFYQLSIHEALDEPKPLVVLFSTPAFCVSATCGPQLDILGRMKEQYRDRVNFIHVEVFEDPHLIEGNRFNARHVPAVDEWGLPTEPWTFIMDGEGVVRAKFEQFTPPEILEAALEEALGG